MELQSANGGKAVAVNIHALIAMHDPLYRPGFQTRQQLCMEVRHISFEKCQCVQRKSYSEAIGRVRRILLEDVNSPIAKAAVDQQPEEQPRRPRSDNVNQHRSTISKSTRSIGVMDYAFCPILHHSITPSVNYI